MFTYDYQKRVRYGETDQMGYLYYGNYPLLYEIGRAEAIRSLGLSYKSMEVDLKFMMSVLLVESRYMAPIKYDELVTIRTHLSEVPTKIIHFKHEIFNEEMKLCHKGEVKLMFVDMITGKRVSTPSTLQESLKPYFDE